MLNKESLRDATLIVDALFGAGLARPLEGLVLEIVNAINARGLTCVGIDVPSGVHGDTGQVMGAAPRCKLTATFFRAKPGHLLLPGRDQCGELVVGEIGISAGVLDEIEPQVFRNGPALWRKALPSLSSRDHKYTRGAVLVVAGAGMTGAARLAAVAARRAGAGLVSIIAPDAASAAVLRAGEAGTIVREGALGETLKDERIAAVLLGPGGGISPALRENVLTALKSRRAVVLDADALSVFADKPDELFAAVSGPCLLTPHEGEFARLFPDLTKDSDKLAKAKAAAQRCGASVLLKGADTVIAAPCGTAIINDNAPASLATAGSGDVLAGFAVALMAQGLDALAAGAAASWLHGAAAARHKRPLIAEDLTADSVHIVL